MKDRETVLLHVLSQQEENNRNGVSNATTMVVA